MNDDGIKKALKHDFSVGTEAFREDLLRRCLEIIDEDNCIRVISDDALDLLAAAGNPYTNIKKDPSND